MKVPGNSVLLAPGYAEASERERLVRDASFLELTESVGGFELKPMSLRAYLVLRLAGCPLLYGEAPTPKQLRQFLLVLSPKWEGMRGMGVMAGWRRWRFFARCWWFMPPRRPLLRTRRAMRRWQRRCELRWPKAEGVIAEAVEYMAETMMDRPGRGKGGPAPSYYSDVCFWWGVLGRHGYVMTRDQVLDTPLKILFQCIREITEAEGGTVTNASSAKAVEEELKRRNEELQSRLGKGIANCRSPIADRQ
jgi:hypothetical protein